MRRSLVGMASLGMVWIAVCGATARSAEWADRLFSESGHDFGPVPRGAKVRHSFVLTNRLTEPVTILNVRASCGCTSGKASNAPIPPGKTGIVEAEMDTRNFVNKKATSLFVTLATAGGKEAEVRLGVVSMILSDIVLNPGTIDFGTVSKGQTPTLTLTIDRMDAPRWEATRMISASRSIKADLVETARSASMVSYKLTVSLKPGAPAGRLRDEIRILTNDPQSPSIPVMVTAQVRGDLSATPSLLSLGRTTAKKGAQGRYLIRSTKPFAIVAVEGAGEGFQVAPTDAARKVAHFVSLTYKPEAGSTLGDLRKTFRVVTDLPGEPPLEINATLHVDP